VVEGVRGVDAAVHLAELRGRGEEHGGVDDGGFGGGGAECGAREAGEVEAVDGRLPEGGAEAGVERGVFPMGLWSTSMTCLKSCALRSSPNG
jgi:hypothetical protein